MRKILAVLVLLCLSSPVLAQHRGPLQGVYASWYDVTNSTTTITLAFNSRDIYLHNGDGSEIICVNLNGGTIGDNCVGQDANLADTFQLDTDQELFLSDYVTGAISLRNLDNSGSASPVNVVVTY